MHVLIVEDYGHAALLMAGLCELAGAKTEIAGAMQEAKGKFAEQRRYDLIFLDLQLPDSSPIESLQELPELKSNARVVVVTGYDSPELRTAAGSADGYLLKDDPDFANKVMAQLAALRK